MEYTKQETELFEIVEDIKEECNKAIELGSTIEELRERIMICLNGSVQLSFDFTNLSE